MKILLLEPFYKGSHKMWAEGLKKHSRFEIEIRSLPGNHWKWRMHGSAVTFAQKALNESRPELLICTDMLDVALFKSLLPTEWKDVPILLYFHENQLTYPWSSNDEDVTLQRDRHYAFINYSSALVADEVCFNSHYHKKSFLETLPKFLGKFPDYPNLESVNTIKKKSRVLYLGLELENFMNYDKTKKNEGRIVWNHRWEYDKNPGDFFQAMFKLKENDIAFELVVLGEQFNKVPPVFEEAKERLRDEIVHWGYCTNRERYVSLLQSCALAPVTSNQDFFGISAVESMAAGCAPLLPNRLAFPEHLNSEEHFYNNQEDLYQKILSFFWSRRNYDMLSVAPQMLKYQWTHCIDEYDGIFEKLIARRL